MFSNGLPCNLPFPSCLAPKDSGSDELLPTSMGNREPVILNVYDMVCGHVIWFLQQKRIDKETLFRSLANLFNCYSDIEHCRHIWKCCIRVNQTFHRNLAILCNGSFNDTPYWSLGVIFLKRWAEEWKMNVTSRDSEMKYIIWINR